MVVVFKRQRFADFPIDLGAEWIHNNPEILDVLSGEDGVSETIDLVPHQLEDVYRWDGEEYEEVPQSALNSLFRFFPEHKFKNSTWFSFVEDHFAKKVEHRIQTNSPVARLITLQTPWKSPPNREMCLRQIRY